MFQFAAFPSVYLSVLGIRCHSSSMAGCPIRVPTVRCLYAAPRGFSQLSAPFFGSRCLGILPLLLFACPFSSLFSSFVFVLRFLLSFGCSRFHARFLRTFPFAFRLVRFPVPHSSLGVRPFVPCIRFSRCCLVRLYVNAGASFAFT